MEITAEIIQDSVSPSGVRLTTFVLSFPRFILAEFNTHRMVSRNSSSCLSADTLICTVQPNNVVRQITIKELYDRFTNGDSIGRDMKNRILNMHLRILNEDTHNFSKSKIKNIFFSGNNPVYKIQLGGGYSVKCTENHRLYTNFGWLTLKEIIKHNKDNVLIGWNKDCKLATNGLEITTEWLLKERDSGKTMKQISTENSIKYKSLASFAEKHKIRFMKVIDTPGETFEYLDANWLLDRKKEGMTNGRIAELCNTTEDRVKKSCKKNKINGFVGNILRGNKKRRPWNTGLKYRLTEEQMRKYRESPKMWQSGEKSASWKGGIKNYKNFNAQVTKWLNDNRQYFLKKFNYKCAITGRTDKLELHHIDPIWNNKERAFDLENIVVLNKYIHREIHKNNIEIELLNLHNSGHLWEYIDINKMTKKDAANIGKPIPKGKCLMCRFKEIINIEYVGIEPTYDIEMDGDYKNFVANGIVVHNSRAIPSTKMLESVKNNPAHPLSFLQNKKGMQGGDPIENQSEAMNVWLQARDAAVEYASKLNDLGVHKQYTNRILEPYMMHKVVATATDWSNFFALRYHKDAQPEIHELAKKMWEVYSTATPMPLEYGQWHLPFIKDKERVALYEQMGVMHDDFDKKLLNDESYMYENFWHPLIKRSVARCARVSYNNFEGSVSRSAEDEDLFNKLLSGEVKHSSPAEHQATPYDPESQEVSPVVAYTKDGNIKDYFFGNLRGWKQFRKTIPNENVEAFNGFSEGTNK